MASICAQNMLTEKVSSTRCIHHLLYIDHPRRISLVHLEWRTRSNFSIMHSPHNIHKSESYPHHQQNVREIIQLASHPHKVQQVNYFPSCEMFAKDDIFNEHVTVINFGINHFILLLVTCFFSFIVNETSSLAYKEKSNKN